MFTRSNIQRHIAICQRLHTCQEEGCRQRSFGTANDLDRHSCALHRRHLDGRPAERYSCPVPACDRDFSRWGGLEEHIHRIHPDYDRSSAQDDFANAVPPLTVSNPFQIESIQPAPLMVNAPFENTPLTPNYANELVGGSNLEVFNTEPNFVDPACERIRAEMQTVIEHGQGLQRQYDNLANQLRARMQYNLNNVWGANQGPAGWQTYQVRNM